MIISFKMFIFNMKYKQWEIQYNMIDSILRYNWIGKINRRYNNRRYNSQDLI